MSKAIIQTVESIIGQVFEPNARQSDQLANLQTSSDIITYFLPKQADAWRREIARPFGFDWTLVPARMVAGLLILNIPTKNAERNPSNEWHAVRRLPEWDVFDLGQIVSAARLPAGLALYPRIDAIYRDVFGPTRAADPEGFVFWMLHIRQGNIKLEDLAGHLRGSEEYAAMGDPKPK